MEEGQIPLRSPAKTPWQHRTARIVAETGTFSKIDPAASNLRAMRQTDALYADKTVQVGHFPIGPKASGSRTPGVSARVGCCPRWKRCTAVTGHCLGTGQQTRMGGPPQHRLAQTFSVLTPAWPCAMPHRARERFIRAFRGKPPPRYGNDGMASCSVSRQTNISHSRPSFGPWCATPATHGRPGTILAVRRHGSAIFRQRSRESMLLFRRHGLHYTGCLAGTMKIQAVVAHRAGLRVTFRLT